MAIINQLGRNENATVDTDNDGLADALEITKMSTEQDKINKAHQAQLAKINHDSEKLAIEREKIKVEMFPTTSNKSPTSDILQQQIPMFTMLIPLSLMIYLIMLI